jgi:hypothetical protein
MASLLSRYGREGGASTIPASAKIKKIGGGALGEDLKEVNNVCNEKAALAANAIQASR